MSLTEGVISPHPFKLWSGITCLAGALERRVWATTGAGDIFPNLYTLLVAPPGVGKFVIETVRDLWQEVIEPGAKLPAFKVASDSVTNASLMDELARAKSTKIMPSGPPVTYHSLLIPTEEFEVLIPSYDKQFIASLNSIFNNKALHKESRRTGTVKELNIEMPQFTILGGAQPAYLAHTFPEEAWSTGFSRRVIMIYSTETPLRSIFYNPGTPKSIRKGLLTRLAHISNIFGPCRWTAEAAEKLDEWHKTHGPPTPQHSKLIHYNRSRSVFVVKLAIISAISARCELVLELSDIDRAIAWLTEAEKHMPDIFRAMTGKSDQQVLEELHFFMWQVYSQGKNKGKNIPSSLIYDFLSQRLPSDKIKFVFEIAEKANIISRVGGAQDLFIPRPKHQHGVE